jgi:hypothetical protein
MHTYYFKGENSITFTLRKVFFTYLVIPRQKNVRFLLEFTTGDTEISDV